MTITSNGAILQRTIVSEGVMFIFRQVVIAESFPTNPIQQVLYIVGTAANYWTGSAWVTLAGGSGSVAWDDITDKPSTFPPEAHTQAISTITGLQDELDDKQDALVSGTNIKTVNSQSLLGSDIS